MWKTICLIPLAAWYTKSHWNELEESQLMRNMSKEYLMPQGQVSSIKVFLPQKDPIEWKETKSLSCSSNQCLTIQSLLPPNSSMLQPLMSLRRT
jgi:hypothetical protein